MKKFPLITRLSAALALVAGVCTTTSVYAGNVVVVPQTNAVGFISLQLTFITQGPTLTNKPATNDISATVVKTPVATKDVIAALGTATTNNFPTTAKLVRVIHLSNADQPTTYEVRYSSNKVDVSEFFTNSTTSESIDQSVYNRVTQLTTGKKYENLHLVFTNAPGYNLAPYFHVTGAATVNYVAVKSGKTTLSAYTVSAPTLAGGGADSSDVPALVTGSMQITGTITEVQ